ncbi:hypothetical protein PS3A_16350 [Pseudomonas sp. 3A(2025)]
MLPAMKLLIAVMVPVRVSALDVPPTVTPPPLLAARLPEPTLRVRVPLLESTSLMLIWLIAEATSSTTRVLAGALISGVSSTAVRAMVRLNAEESRLPSLTLNCTVRVKVEGASARLV